MMIRSSALALVLAACALPGAAMSAETLQVSETGLGPITAATPLDRDAIQRLFPGSTVTTDTTQGVPVAIIQGPGDLLVYAWGDEGGVYAATASGANVRGPKGEKTGDALSSLQNGTLSCRFGAEVVTCYSADMRMIEYTVYQPVGTDSRVAAIGWRRLAPRR
ncbi:MAG: hypothetical protein ACOY4K_14340 [Pseudomonadota bacterium]